MSNIKKLFKQSSHYSMGHFLSMISGVISFPIFTRIFSVSDYGVLNIISSTLLFMVAFSKFGLQNAVIRFYEEFKSGKRMKNIGQFYSTLFLGSVMISGGIAFLFWIGIRIVLFNSRSTHIFRLLSFTAILIFIRSTNSIIMNFFRAKQETRWYNTIGVVQKYCSLGLSLFFVLYFIKGLYGFYTGTILAEAFILMFLIYKSFKKHIISFRNVSIPFLKESIKYGMPLIAFEFGSIILAYADRFLIQYYLGSNAVGFYSAGYNFTKQISFIFILPLGLALSPIYMNIWANKGEKEVKIFLNKALNYYLLLAIPIIFGLSAMCKEVISFIASAKYADSYLVIPFIIAGLMIYGTYHIFAAGIYIYKKTFLLSVLIFVAGSLNIVMNIIFIPIWGIKGVAVATLLAYLLLTGLIVVYSFKYLDFRIQYRSIVLYTTISLLMFLVIRSISLSDHLLNILAKAFGGFMFYTSIVVAFDIDLRKKIIENIWR